MESIIDPIRCLSKFRKQQDRINLKFKRNENTSTSEKQQPKHDLTPSVQEIKGSFESICWNEVFTEDLPWISVAEITHSTKPKDNNQNEQADESNQTSGHGWPII